MSDFLDRMVARTMGSPDIRPRVPARFEPDTPGVEENIEELGPEPGQATDSVRRVADVSPELRPRRRAAHFDEDRPSAIRLSDLKPPALGLPGWPDSPAAPSVVGSLPSSPEAPSVVAHAPDEKGPPASEVRPSTERPDRDSAPSVDSARSVVETAEREASPVESAEKEASPREAIVVRPQVERAADAMASAERSMSRNLEVLPEPKQEPTVHVRIGRIEVRAVPAPEPQRAPRRPATTVQPGTDLDSYLLQRARGLSK